MTPFFIFQLQKLGFIGMINDQYLILLVIKSNLH